MKKGQTSRRGGIQDILLPMEYFRCLQGDFEGNHPWYACDMSGKDSGRDLFYAPVDVICVATNPKDGNAVWWQSQEKVRFADGTIDYFTMMVLHDNTLSGIYVGVRYAQGQQIAQEGTAGYANGNHLHVEVAKGKFQKMYAHNERGYYLPNGIAIETVCFADNTTFLTSKNWHWKYTQDVPAATVTSKMKYGIGTKVCVQQLARSADGSAGLVPSHYKGTITRVYAGQPYPYLLDNGAGYVNDQIIDADPHTPK